MGSGLAKQIREKWPIVFEQYSNICRSAKHDFKLLGEYHYINIVPNLWVCNIFGQLDYGRGDLGKRFTDYGALIHAFENMDRPKSRNIYFPYNFGCDRGGGDWKIVERMLDFYFPHAIVCKL